MGFFDWALKSQALSGNWKELSKLRADIKEASDFKIQNRPFLTTWTKFLLYMSCVPSTRSKATKQIRDCLSRGLPTKLSACAVRLPKKLSVWRATNVFSAKIGPSVEFFLQKLDQAASFFCKNWTNFNLVQFLPKKRSSLAFLHTLTTTWIRVSRPAMFGRLHYFNLECCDRKIRNVVL